MRKEAIYIYIFYSPYGIQLIYHCDIVLCIVLSSRECPYSFRCRNIAILLTVLLIEINTRRIK